MRGHAGEPRFAFCERRDAYFEISNRSDESHTATIAMHMAERLFIPS